MLRYLNKGLRNYNAINRLPCHTRSNWEFMIVTKGALRPVNEAASFFEYSSSHLWILSPNSKHGWQNSSSSQCFVYCFHFSSIHTIMQNYLSKEGFLSVALKKRDLQQISDIYESIYPHYTKPHPWSALPFHKAMIDLCSIVINRIPLESKEIEGYDAYALKVQQAVQWHLHNPSDALHMHKIAKAIHVSPSHFRRMFLKVKGKTPKKVFMEATLENACKLMSETSLSLKEIATQCGFKGFCQFYQCFKQHYKISPSDWRNSMNYGKLGFKSKS